MGGEDRAVLARSSGEVTQPYAYSDRTHLPEPEGLYCESVFGPVSWKHGEPMEWTDARADRCGHFVFPEPVTWGERGPRNTILIVPPAYRKFLRLAAEDRRALARVRRQELIDLANSGRWPYAEPAEKVLAEEGLANLEDIKQLGGGFLEPALNVAYRGVVNRARRLARMLGTGPTDPNTIGVRQDLAVACGRVDNELRKCVELPAELRDLALGLVRSA